MNWAPIAAFIWRLAKPVLAKAAKDLRDKWAAELKEHDAAAQAKKEAKPNE